MYRKIDISALKSADWGANSKVVDGDGCLQVVYRGQHGLDDNWTESLLGSLSFGTAEVAVQYAEHPNCRHHQAAAPKVFPVFLEIKKPFVADPRDPFVDVADLATLLGFDEAIRLVFKYRDYVYDTDAWSSVSDQGYESLEAVLADRPTLLLQLCLLLYPLLDDPLEVTMLVSRGFDGAIYGGSGISAHSPEYRVFSLEQIRSVWDSSLGS